jgi:dUTP pyrophosphatase
MHEQKYTPPVVSEFKKEYEVNFMHTELVEIFVNIKLVSPDAKLPSKKTWGAAAYDIYSSEDTFIKPDETKLIGTGLIMEIPYGYKGEIYSRSGLALKGIVVANQPGKIDSDYRGEVKVILRNSGHLTFEIRKGDRIAQFEVNRVLAISFKSTDELSTTERGDQGFGSTGK